MKNFTLITVRLALLVHLLVSSAFAKVTESDLDTTVNSKIKSTQSQLQILNPQTIDALSQHNIWQRLLVYKNGKSRVLDSTFFVSDKGKTDPKAELQAGLQMLSHADTAKDYLCRFPARSHWLMSQIPALQNQLQGLIGGSSCAKVDEWLNSIDARQISLIYAEEHVNRIGSSLGHTLVRIDNGKSLASNHTDDAYFFNFATDEDIVKQQGLKANLNALRGRGIGSMTFGKYTPKQANYLLIDQRDIWQYQLKLPQQTIDQIMRQLWEVKSAYRYYNFLNYNCASEILRMIDASSTGDMATSYLLADAGKVIAPAEVARTLNKHGFLKSQQFVPALRTVKQGDLNNHKKVNNINSPQYTAQYTAQAIQNALPALIPSDNNPLDANPIHRVKVAVTHQSDNNKADKNRFIFGMRGAYQDLLDSPAGKRDFLNSTLLSMDISYSNKDKVQVEEATLIDLLMLNPKNGTDPHASLGGHLKITPVIDASDSNNERHRVASFGAEYGASWLLGKGKVGTGEVANTLCYALGDVQGQAGRIHKGYRVGLAMHAGCVNYVNDKLRVMADARLPYWYHGNIDSVNKDSSDNNVKRGDVKTRDHYFQPRLSLAGQYDFANHQAIRASVEQQKNFDKTDTNYRVSYHWFFD